jgi:hypothetical protein
MVTQQDLVDFFGRLLMLNCRRPDAWKSPDDMREAAGLYATLLADITPADLARAFIAYARRPHNPDFQRPFPDPGQILTLADQGSPSPEDEAEGAWAALQQRVRKRPTDPLDLPESATAQAMRAGVESLGGWRAIVATLPEAPVHEGRTFKGAFVAALRASRARREQDVVETICAGRPTILTGGPNRPRLVRGTE